MLPRLVSGPGQARGRQQARLAWRSLAVGLALGIAACTLWHAWTGGGKAGRRSGQEVKNVAASTSDRPAILAFVGVQASVATMPSVLASCCAAPPAAAAAAAAACGQSVSGTEAPAPFRQHPPCQQRVLDADRLHHGCSAQVQL